MRYSQNRWRLPTQIYTDSFETPIGLLTIWYIIKENKPVLIRVIINSPLKDFTDVDSVVLVKKPLSSSVRKEFLEYLSGQRRVFTVAHALIGTDFEKKVWTALKDIPYGETRSYKWLALAVGSPKSPRAVGQALGRNPLPLIIPCHRIIHEDGRIGGYSSGTDIKRRLLDIEYYNTRKS